MVLKFIAIRGLTLLELIICIIILAILASVTFPLTQTLVAVHRRQVVEKHLSSALNAARSAAINKRRIVTLCPSLDKKHCIADWHQQWLLFIDADANAELRSVNRLLQLYMPISYGNLYFSAFPRNNYFRFLPNGFPAQQNGSFYSPLNG